MLPRFEFAARLATFPVPVPVCCFCRKSSKRRYDPGAARVSRRQRVDSAAKVQQTPARHRSDPRHRCLIHPQCGGFRVVASANSRGVRLVMRRLIALRKSHALAPNRCNEATSDPASRSDGMMRRSFAAFPMHAAPDARRDRHTDFDADLCRDGRRADRLAARRPDRDRAARGHHVAGHRRDDARRFRRRR